MDEASNMNEMTLGAGLQKRGKQGHLGTWRRKRSCQGNGEGRSRDLEGKLGAVMVEKSQ